MKDINLLKNHVNDLRKDIAILHRRNHPPSVPSTCHIRIIFPGTNPISAVLLETDGVSNLLGCPALTVVKISVNTLKVKIPKECLYTALLSSQRDSHLVHIWKNKLVKPISTSQAPHHKSVFPTSPNLTICSWNCRGLHNSLPYIESLVSSNVDIIILQEHWLWPFQLHQLQSVCASYSYTAVCDERLNSSSDLRRGCGGVAILWKKNLNAVPSQLESDGVCSIQVPLKNSPPLFSFGVYMPSSDQPQETYSYYLEALSRDISLSAESIPGAPIITAGDLNCHLGHLGGPRSPNIRAYQWKDIIDHHSLYVPSLCQFASSPVHTYHSGSASTTVDYFVGNSTLASFMESCETLEDHSLNTSDHLPIVTRLNLSLLPSQIPIASSSSLNWDRSVKEGSVSIYTSLSDDVVRPLLEKDYSCIEEVDQDIEFVSSSLLNIASSTIAKRIPRVENIVFVIHSYLLSVGKVGLHTGIGKLLAVLGVGTSMKKERKPNGTCLFICPNVGLVLSAGIHTKTR